MAEGPGGAERGEGKARRVFPPPCEEVEEIYGDLGFPRENPSDPTLPYVAINMVSSVDGKVSLEGKSGAIGGGADRAAMRVLRSKADAVAVGAGTLRAEKVSLTSGGRRTPEPKAVLATASLSLPMGNLVDARREGTIILVPGGICGEAEREAARRLEDYAEVVYAKAGPGGWIDFAEALRALKVLHGINILLLEGGPGMNSEFVSRGLASEIFLTVSPKLLGGSPGESIGILSGRQIQKPPNAALSSVHVSSPDGEVFLRYKLAESGVPIEWDGKTGR